MEYQQAFSIAKQWEEENACGHGAQVARALYRQMALQPVEDEREDAVERALKYIDDILYDAQQQNLFGGVEDSSGEIQCGQVDWDELRESIHAHFRKTLGQPAVAQPVADELSAAARDVLAERRRQQEVEGWTPERDDKYINCDLARAAATYALCTRAHELKVCDVVAWPWPIHWWKSTTYRRNLEKAGALILAEIERLDRAALDQSAEEGVRQ